MATQREDWISIAQQVTAETDSTKLIALVDQLFTALDAIASHPTVAHRKHISPLL